MNFVPTLSDCFSLGVALEEAIKSAKSSELVGVANEEIIRLLSGNLTSGDPSFLLQMVCVPCYSNLNKFYFSGGDCNRTNVIQKNFSWLL